MPRYQYTSREYANMHFIYGECRGNANAAARLYAERYPNARHPDYRVFARVHNSYCEGRLPGRGIGGTGVSRPKMSKPTPNPAKALLREQIAAAISTLSTEEKQRQSKIVYNKIVNHPFYKSSKRISLYMSTPDEVDTAPIIANIRAKGGEAFVPQYAGGIMKMLRLETGDEEAMPVTKHGIQQHAKSQPRADALESGGLDLIIAPGVAFSRAGDRLGHGGGYYDKFITGLRANPATAPKVLAIAFNVQVVDSVPMDPQDHKVDEVIFAE